MCAEKDNIIRFPVELSGKPPDAIEVFLRRGKKERKTGVVDEPECLKDIPDIKVIENIIIKKDGATYKNYKKYENQTSDKPVTFGLIREVLKESESLLAENRRDVDIIKSYIDFLVIEFKDTLDREDLLAQAELYRYLAKINEKVTKKELWRRSTIHGPFNMPRYETNAMFHFRAGNLYETLSKKETRPDKKEDWAREAASEYLGQILVYELKKELSQEDFDDNIKSASSTFKKNNMALDLAMTLASYDSKIKELNDKILKLTKIK